MNVSDPQRAFVVQWSGATVGNGADIGGYNVIISGSDDGCRVRGVPQFTAGEQYRCPMPSVGVTYNFSVSAVCGTLEGTAAEAGITLRGTIDPFHYKSVNSLGEESNSSPRLILHSLVMFPGPCSHFIVGWFIFSCVG